ncbi:MAG: hypothetical protein ABFC96_00490 [Thermoguttaceae bacterium]
MRLLARIVLAAAALSFVSAGVRPVEAADKTPANGSDQWRFVYFNSEWWYWLPEGRWLYWSDNRWNSPDETSFDVCPIVPYGYAWPGWPGYWGAYYGSDIRPYYGHAAGEIEPFYGNAVSWGFGWW